jgi:tetrahydromethanopterin S-methyltransferase subunit G
MRKQEILPADAFDAMLRADELEERVEFCECKWGDPGGDGCCIVIIKF